MNILLRSIFTLQLSMRSLCFSVFLRWSVIKLGGMMLYHVTLEMLHRFMSVIDFKAGFAVKLGLIIIFIC